MNATARIGAYLAGLGVIFTAGLGIGAAVGPVGPAADPPRDVQTNLDHNRMD